MSNQPLNLVLQQLVLCLKRVNEPVSIDELIRFSKISVKDPSSFKAKMKELLSMAVGLGLVQEHNEHYFATTHPQDILPLLKEDSESKIETVSSEDIFEEASLMSITSEEIFQEFISEIIDKQ